MKLGVKINIVIVLATVVVLTSAFAIVVNNEGNKIKNQVIGDAKTSVSIFHKEIEHIFKHILDQQTYLQNTINELSRIEGVLYIHITDMSGVHVAATEKELIGSKADESDMRFIEEIKSGRKVADMHKDEGAYYELERRVPVHLVYGDESSEIVDVIEVEVATRSKSTADINQAEKLLQVISAGVEQAGRSVIVARAENIKAIQEITEGAGMLGKLDSSEPFGFYHHFMVSDEKMNVVASFGSEKYNFKNDTPEHNKLREDVLAGNISEASYESFDHGGYTNVLISVRPVQFAVNGENKIVGLVETHFLTSSYTDRISALMLRMTIVGALFTVLLVMLLIATLERMVVGPLRHYSLVVKKVAEGDLSQKIEHVSKDEIGRFGEMFNSMIESLREIDHLKSDFISVAAHQLRTPLSGVKWVLKLMLDGDLGSISNDQKEMLKRGYETNEKMIQLVNDLLNVSRIDNKKFGYEFKKDDFSKLLYTLIGNSDLSASQHNIEMQYVNRIGDIPEFIFDADKVMIALQNIVDNAIKYTLPGGKVSVIVEKNGDFIEIKVSDTGVGIPKADLSKLFSKFFRATNVIHLQTEGSGLGLFIVKNIIEKHGGKIFVDSVEGKGTTFIVTIPTNPNFLQKDKVNTSGEDNDNVDGIPA